MRATRIKTIRALERGLDVLQVLQASAAMDLHDLHQATALPKATLMRILRTLNDRGLVWQRIADGAYLLSYTLRERAPHLDDEAHLVEVSSPILEALCRRVNWPSILAAPRLDYMEVIETNSPRSYLAHIPLGPIGFRINMLRSATGRAYLAFCSESERQAVLARLRASPHPGDAGARNSAWVARVLAETRRRGFAARDPSFGGHFDKSRREVDDGRNSIAVPIIVDARVIGSINMTWTVKAGSIAEVGARHVADLKRAASDIAARMLSPVVDAPGAGAGGRGAAAASNGARKAVVPA
jgi:IclR family mhp operon transcriptional activator